MYEAVIVFTLDTTCPWYVVPILALEDSILTQQQDISSQEEVRSIHVINNFPTQEMEPK